MKIVIIGGTGLIGKKLTPLLSNAGHEVLPASPSSGVNTLTGEGLADAFAGADVVVDVSNSPSFEAEYVMNFFATSAKKIAEAEKAAGVKHHIALSVVGADRMDSGYMRAKIAQEKIIADSGIPYTIVRATQFYEFLTAVAESGSVDGVPHLPPVLMQPLAADDVAAELAKIAIAAPVNGIVELAGPEKATIAEFAQRALTAKKDTRKVIADEASTYFGAKVDDRSLVPGLGHPQIASTRFEEWAARQ
jgi:uncharacterized protein YbjT (DUF2867 family)